MMGFDLVIRNADVATASDRFRADIGVRDGRIAAIGLDLAAGADEIDAGGRLVTPGGVDAHCHLDQPTTDGSRMADDFLTGTRSAACGGTTTVIPFACQAARPVAARAVADYHRRAEGKAAVDYAFHLIVSDPTPKCWRGTAGAGPRGLQLVQAVHDLRRPQARRPPDPRAAGGGARARRDGDDPRRERRLHRAG
jgi:N-acyl-D-aspartate/D-glutamate deacylase